MKNANLLFLALSSLPARCCDVSFLSTSLFPVSSLLVFVTSFAVIGTCLDFAAEDRWVTERNAALERMSAGFETLWSDPRRRSAIVLLQDRAQHIGESVDGCR
jgi:hypothetical protein